MQITFKESVIFDDTDTGLVSSFQAGHFNPRLEIVEMPRLRGAIVKNLGTSAAIHNLTLTYLVSASEWGTLDALIESLQGASAGSLVVPRINGTITLTNCILQTVQTSAMTPAARLNGVAKDKITLNLTFLQIG